MIRHPWMGGIRPKMRNRRCSGCGWEYAVWLGFLSMRHESARRVVFCCVVFWTAVAMLVITHVVSSYFRLRAATVF